MKATNYKVDISVRLGAVITAETAMGLRITYNSKAILFPSVATRYTNADLFLFGNIHGGRKGEQR
jgi:hypothetical protein